MTGKMGVIAVNLIGLLIVFGPQLVFGKRTVIYDLPGPHCGASRNKVDAALLRTPSKPLYGNTACVMKFEAHDSFFNQQQHFMLNVRRFNVTNCNVALKVYYHSEYRLSAPDLTLDCHRAAPLSIIDTGSRYVTVRLEKVAVTGYQFELILTAYETGTSCMKDRTCANGRCIDRDLFCDQVDNCSDESDEHDCPLTSFSEVHTRNLHMSGGLILMVGFLGGVMVLIFLCVLVILCCRHRRATQGRVISLHPQGQAIGPQGQVIGAQPIVTETTALPPPSYYQAGYSTGPQGYPAAQAPYPGGQYPQQQYPQQQYPGAPQYPGPSYPSAPYATQQYPAQYQSQ